MLLSNLSKIINIEKVYNFKSNNNFASITSNSKLVNKNTIFIYDKNSKAKKIFIEEAIKNNTPAIISNKYFKFINIPQFIVSDINYEKELLLKKIYKKLPYKTIAVTGTNGKTSVVWYISQILSKLKYNTCSYGTLGYFRNGKKINDTNLTTPAYEELYKFGFFPNKKNIFIFEASSHALDQNRIGNYPIDIGAITNISHDHLDYHKSFLDYKKAKLKLFTKHLSNKGYAVVNSRIKNVTNFTKKIKSLSIKTNFFGTRNIYLKKINKYYYLFLNKYRYQIKKLNLNTDFELENLECAILCCMLLNISEKKIVKTLPYINNPIGRLQTINYIKKKSKIIIDYAHTPDALKRILKSLTLNKKKPNLLFGCGGNRDKDKRMQMGIIANNYANKVYITDDNPRYENPLFIRKSILKYCPSAFEIPNRKNAIIKAVQDIGINEILIIAGKGHEKIQIIKNKKIKFDDFQIVKKLV